MRSRLLARRQVGFSGSFSVTCSCGTFCCPAGLACGRERRKNTCRAPSRFHAPLLPCVGFLAGLASVLLCGVK